MNDKQIRELIEQANKKVDIPDKLKNRVNSQDTLEKSILLLEGVFQGKLHTFIDTVDDEKYFLKELQKHLTKVFPRKKKRSGEFIQEKKKDMADRWKEGGTLYFNKKEFKESCAQDSNFLSAYKKKYPNAPTSAEELKAYSAKKAEDKLKSSKKAPKSSARKTKTTKSESD